MTAKLEPVHERPPASEDAESELAAKPFWRKVLLFGVVVAALLALAYQSALREYLGQVRITQYIRDLGWLAPLVLTSGVAVLVAMGVPRLLLCVIAGTALGFWSGLLWTQLGTLVGNYAVFVLVRRGGRDWAERYLAKRGKLHSLIHQEGLTGVILARQLPLPGLFINLACGLVAIRHRDFLLGTLLGQLPAAIPCTLIGAGAIQPSFGKSLGVISLAVVAAVALWSGLRYALRWQQTRGEIQKPGDSSIGTPDSEP